MCVLFLRTCTCIFSLHVKMSMHHLLADMHSEIASLILLHALPCCHGQEHVGVLGERSPATCWSSKAPLARLVWSIDAVGSLNNAFMRYSLRPSVSMKPLQQAFTGEFLLASLSCRAVCLPLQVHGAPHPTVLRLDCAFST